ncbi:MarR family winged helix-turn-helix transcriptional regulator [Paenibacillus segetis]|uniref:MarR family transcriptional regulator n=1 Tax=Paenibacillus segetis TaxID=1325360 RepID=A0ABQ1YNY5_9BACL|nr:MarR family transcriptional regulator [Paenibacillus segetis]GGH31676.1 MarR family transcriptional regulator [Paenibacillus segetis]
MSDLNKLLDLIFDNIRPILFPEEIINLDLTLSKTELLMMIMLDRYGEITMSQMAEYSNIPMSTATGIVDRLVKLGYMKRNRSEADRRIVVIALSEMGEKLVSELKKQISEYVTMIDQALTDEEKSLLFNLFIKISQLFREKSMGAAPAEQPPALTKIKID